MRIAVITVTRGRHDHLRLQRKALATSAVPIDRHIVVAMDDSGVAPVLPEVDLPTELVHIAPADDRLPLAAARNLGAHRALADGAGLLIFLDVDCLPSAALVQRYCQAADLLPGDLLSGPVAYLDPPPPGGYDLAALSGAGAHAARPTPADDAIAPGADHRLFWSLSFAITAGTWRAVGGFCERYVGYGAEDTDFGQLALQHGADHVWVGGAWAFHQHHATQDPPVQHLDDIVRNARVFHERWGWWPMRGWFEAFEERGLVRRDSDGWTTAFATATPDRRRR